jgi:hypothetical protein
VQHDSKRHPYQPPTMYEFLDQKKKKEGAGDEKINP